MTQKSTELPQQSPGDFSRLVVVEIGLSVSISALDDCRTAQAERPPCVRNSP